jgi:hypothetical protein
VNFGTDAMMKPLRKLKDRFKNCMGLLLTVAFFLGVVALALHHHDAFFPLKSCAICKAKASLAGTLSKIKADHPLLTAAVNHDCRGISLAVSWMRFDHQTPFVEPLFFHRLSNKAPPSIS